jgi:hypothetical protein
MRTASKRLSERFDRVRDGPDESRELSRHRNDDLIAVHAARGKPTKASTQAKLCFPADRTQPRIEAALALGNVPGDARREAVGMRRLDQRAARRAVAGFGDAALTASFTGRILTKESAPGNP